MINKHIIVLSIFVKECSVINIYHRDALKVWDQIKVGDGVRLVLSGAKILPEKEYKDKVDVYELNTIKEEIIDKEKPKTIDLIIGIKEGDHFVSIGELSEDDSKLIIDFLRQGWRESLSGRISSVQSGDKDENKRIKVVIYIEENPKK